MDASVYGAVKVADHNADPAVHKASPALSELDQLANYSSGSASLHPGL
jgi:hypothetical protein